MPMDGVTEKSMKQRVKEWSLWIETDPTEDPSHKQLPKPDTIVDANKCLLRGAWYSCLLRGCARAWQIQRQMLATNHWTECGIPNGGVRERTEGAEGVCNPIGRTTMSTNQTPQSSQGLNHQPKSTHGEMHSSSHIRSRGWPCGTPIRKALGPVKCQCHSVWECQDGKLESVGELGNTVIEAGGGGWDRGFLEGNQERDTIWKVNQENIK